MGTEALPNPEPPQLSQTWSGKSVSDFNETAYRGGLFHPRYRVRQKTDFASRSRLIGRFKPQRENNVLLFFGNI
jgi:hypothetical protein